MLNKAEIEEAFRLLGLMDETERQRILSQTVVQSEIESEDISYTITDNITTLGKEGESQNA